MIKNNITQTGRTVDIVRQYASVQGIVRKKQIRLALDISLDRVKSAVTTLVKQGYLVKVSHGTYHFQELRERPQFPVEELIWRALKINTTFTASSIARQASSTTPYVYKIFRQLREDGYLKPYGRKCSASGGVEKIWRLTYKGKERADNPAEVKFQPDALVEQTVTLNKLICSGRARRDEDARVQAIALCNQIAAQLTEDMEA